MIRRSAFRLSLGAFACLSAIALTACSLLLGEGFTDPNEAGQDSGTSDTSATDGSTPTTDGSSGGVDGTAKDDAGASDAGSDGSCPTAKASLCDDFNRNEQQLQNGWSTVQLSTGGAITLVNASPSGKRLESAIMTANASAYLEKVTNVAPTKLHFELTLDYAALPTQAVHIVGGSMMPSSSAGPSLVYLYADTDSVYLVQQVADSASYRRDPIPVSSGSAHRIVIDVELGGDTKVTVDGNTALDRPTSSFLVSNPVTIALGIASLSDNASTFTMHADDFVFTAD